MAKSDTKEKMKTPMKSKEKKVPPSYEEPKRPKTPNTTSNKKK